jgi:hypothetical protein
LYPKAKTKGEDWQSACPARVRSQVQNPVSSKRERERRKKKTENGTFRGGF